MTTDNIKYSRHIYKKLDKSFESYKEFELFKIVKGKCMLPRTIRIEKNWGKNKSKNIKTWLRIKDSDLWGNCTLVTGLRKGLKNNVFEGNRAILIENELKPESLILLQYSNSCKTLTIDYFKGFYPLNPRTRQRLVNTHNFN